MNNIKEMAKQMVFVRPLPRCVRMEWLATPDGPLNFREPMFRYFITRPSGIPFEGWETAVSLIPGMRWDSDSHLSASVLTRTKGGLSHDWRRTFFYETDRIRFRIGPALLDHEATLPVIQAAFTADRLLDAQT